MMARKQLVAAYDSWEQWTQIEGVAIQEGNWRRVQQCQAMKLELQGCIIRLTDAVKAECAKAGLEAKDFEPTTRQIINALIAQESRNAELLTHRRQAATAQMADLDHAGRNLKRVQRFYGLPAPMAWHSYS